MSPTKYGYLECPDSRRQFFSFHNYSWRLLKVTECNFANKLTNINLNINLIPGRWLDKWLLRWALICVLFILFYGFHSIIFIPCIFSFKAKRFVHYMYSMNLFYKSILYSLFHTLLNSKEYKDISDIYYYTNFNDDILR